VIYSLQMLVEKLADGSFVVHAPWLEEPLEGPSFEAAYWAARKAAHVQPAE
jgi:hypothetical protein